MRHEALSSNPSTSPIKKERERERERERDCRNRGKVGVHKPRHI
jgi:hypothetical protein